MQEFDSYEGDYEPKTGFAPDVKTLPVGRMMEFEFTSAAIKSVQSKTLVESTVRCLTPGLEGEYQHTWWIYSAQKFNFFAGDLLKLGFDADKWGSAHNHPLSVEVPRAVARLTGIRFRAMNTTRQTKDGDFTDFKILGKANSPRLAPPPAANNGQQPAATGARTSPRDEDIPF